MEELGNHANQPLRLASKEVSLEKVLDLTNKKVKNFLQISNTSKLTSYPYELTQQIGDFAKKYGFDGIKAPSAVNKPGVNLIIFKKEALK